MEAGRQLILKDFDRIYGALYDVLNQNYRERKVQTAAGEKLLRICRVASRSAARFLHARSSTAVRRHPSTTARLSDVQRVRDAH